METRVDAHPSLRTYTRLNAQLVDPRSTEHLQPMRILVLKATVKAEIEGEHMLRGKLN